MLCMLPVPLWQITPCEKLAEVSAAFLLEACLAVADSVMMSTLYVQMQAATAAAATTQVALQEEKSALESRLQDNATACAALEAKVKIPCQGLLS